ncbi:hypothetical protein [Myroides odoratimimus]|uniref:hypothetical protein n=2 Tax=Myroides odoratimimus TaxID=76832 RepID=UPI003D2FD6D8
MIKKIIPLTALFFSGYVTAQVGVGTKKPADATMLDVTATDKGVLLPRVNLLSQTDNTTVKGKLIESLLVYNIGSSNLKAGFYYWFENKWTPLMSGATFTDTTNKSFTISEDQERLVITDTENNKVELEIKDIAKNSVFVTNLTENSEFVTKLVENKEFITKLGDNIEFVENITNNQEFIENIINKLEGDFGNVGYDKDKNQFFYLKDGKVNYIDWSDLDTVNVKFSFDDTKANLVITDSKCGVVSISTDELGETIAKNSVFVTNLTENSEFVTKLVENKEFITEITNNQEFIENIINKLEGDFGNVGYDKDKNQFFYLKDGKVNYIDWSDLDTVNVKFSFDDTKANLVITDSKGGVVSISTDELGETIAKNSVFVTNLTENSEFVTKLVENKEFITKLGDNIEFVENITNNQEFIENIINKLEGDFGNVGYDKDKNQFFYLKDGKVNYIDWSDLDTVNAKFSFDDTKANLVITDSKGGVVSISTDELGETIAKNDVFVTNLTENKEFITKLVENKEFITEITNNQEFIENVINKLEGQYGNVGYDVAKNEFFYIDTDGSVKPISWSDLDTVNAKFSFDDTKANLVITDSKGGVVSISTDELGETIAKNDVFVTNLTENKEFVTKLVENKEFITEITNNQEFIENVINKLEGQYGNVGYDVAKNEFFYIDTDGSVKPISWSDLDTVNAKFSFDDTKANLVITDSKGGVVSISTDELGETIAKNDVFVTNLTENKEFITKLVENKEFITEITNNQEFIENIINKLEGQYGNVGYDVAKNEFFYIDTDGSVKPISWSDLDTVNAKFSFDDTKANLVITDSKGGVVSISTDELGEAIAKNDVFVTNLTENKEFITKLVENKEFITEITNNQEFIENVINKLEGQYGNVGYDVAKNEFFYIDTDGSVKPISWSDLDTVNAKFSFDDTKANLVITDSKGGVVSISTDELGEAIAKNDVFVTNLTENKEFITKLVENKEFITEITNNQEFIENIINKLEGQYGNVGYDVAKNEFFYIDTDGSVKPISWSDLDTVNAKFSFDDTKANLVITDSKGGVVSISTDELGETIAKNSVFVTNLTENKEFITKLVENKEFITEITNNQEFIENVINKLEGQYGNVGYDVAKNEFFYIDTDGSVKPISWSDLDTVNAKFSFDDTKANLVITDSKGGVVSISTDELGEAIAKNDVFVTNLTENKEFVTKLVENKEFITEITNNQEFIENVINKLEGQYGNVGYDVAKNEFFYIDTDGSVKPISWSDLDTVNAKFSFDDTKANLVITDSKGGVVSISTDELGETIAKNDVFVTNLTENKEFITKLVENKEFITEITNNQEFIENVINKLEGDFGNVVYDDTTKEFTYIKQDGSVGVIDWSAAVKSVETETTLIAEKDASDKLTGKYTYTNEKKVVTQIDVVQSVIDNSKTIFEDNSVIKEIINQIEKEAAPGTVTVVEKDGDFIFTWKDISGTEHTTTIKEIVSKFETLTLLTGANTDDKALLVYTDEDKKIHELDLTVLLQNSSVFNEFLKNFVNSVSVDETITAIVAEQKDGKNTGNYDYFNEERALAGYKPLRISVVSDVENNFQEIINNKNVQEILNKYITDNVEGNVTYEGGKFYVTVKDGDTYKTEQINIEEIVKLSETETTLIAEKDASDKLTGKYTYTNEKNVVTQIDVVQSVIDNSKTIFEDNSVIKEIINQIEKEAAPGTVTVVEKDGDFIFTWKDISGTEHTKGLVELIKENSTVASLVLKDTGNTNKVKAGFVFNSGANNTADVVFAETLTELEKGYRTHNVNGEDIDLKEYYFIDETRNRDDVIIKVSETIIDEFDKLVKFDKVKNTLNEFISNVSGDVSVVKVGDDIVIKDNKSKVEVNLTNEIKDKETKTTLEAVKYDMYVYMVEVNGEYLEEHTDVKREGETALREYQATKYVYTNELGIEKEIKGSELFGATGSGSGSLETLTSLSFDAKYGEDLNAGQAGRPALIYKDEEKNISPIFIDQMFQSSETLTSLEAKADTRELIYIDEQKNKHFISYDVLVQEPWYTGQDQQATKNDQDIYTMGWVGIGYKEKSGAPNEKLRVNGSITATNSYYADYVFESYFDGYSSLKYDYKFNDLNTVDSYIKSNRHLPGITPISDLEKTETGYSFNVSELSIQLLEKTEELFLHVIDQQKELNAKDSEIKDLKKDVNDLTKRLEALEALLK